LAACQKISFEGDLDLEQVCKRKALWCSPIFIQLVSGERQVSDRKSEKRRFEPMK